MKYVLKMWSRILWGHLRRRLVVAGHVDAVLDDVARVAGAQRQVVLLVPGLEQVVDGARIERDALGLADHREDHRVLGRGGSPT